MSRDIDLLFATPDHHFLSFDGDMAIFLPMDRLAYHRSAFLDGRAAALPGTPLRMSLDPLLDKAREHQSPRIGWIFHIARCGSTLLSRLIDGDDGNLVLREPPPLRQVGLEAAMAGRERWHDRLLLAHAMAARRYVPNRPTVVKANVPVNFILEDIRQLDPEAPSILLHFALEPYLLAILRAPPHRIWVERITDQLAARLAERIGLMDGATIAQRAVALWLAQMLAFASLLELNPGGSRSLDANQLFASPAATTEAAALHLGIAGLDIEANVSALATSYAKDMAKPFDEGLRRQREADDRRRLEPELTEARQWLDQCAAARQLPERLSHPLIGEAPVLLG